VEKSTGALISAHPSTQKNAIPIRQRGGIFNSMTGAQLKQLRKDLGEAIGRLCVSMILRNCADFLRRAAAARSSSGKSATDQLVRSRRFCHCWR
jgi:hypothetical protein